MPYNNNYNRSIAKQHLDNVKNLIHHQENTDQIFHMTGMPNIRHSTASKTGGAIPQYLNDDIKYGVNQGVRAVYADASQYGSNQDDNEKYMNENTKKGGSGFAEGTHMDTGFERTLGGSKMKGSKMKGSKIFKKASLKLVKTNEIPTEDKIEGGKRKRGRPSKKDLEGGMFYSKFYNDHKDKMVGQGFFSDFGKGFMSVIKPVASVAKSVLKIIPDPRAQMAGQALEAVGAGKRKRGRPSKKVLEGGTLLGLPTKVIRGKGRPKKVIIEAPIEVVKKTRGRPRKVGGMGIDDNNLSGGRKLVPVANMKASYMAGFGKPKRINKRAEIVKKIMNEKKMSMIQASKYVKDHNLYVK